MTKNFNCKIKVELSFLLFFTILITSSFFTFSVVSIAPIEPPPIGNFKITCYGYVKDYNTELGIGGAVVKLSEDEWGISKTFTTGSSGYYYLTISVPSYIRFKLTITCSGYEIFTNSHYQPGTYRCDPLLQPLGTHIVTCFGYVKDAHNNMGISGATVKLASPTPGGLSKTKITSSSGYYSVSLATTEQKNYDLSASKVNSNYLTDYKKVYSSGSHNINFFLSSPVMRYAVIVGVSDYKVINNLSYCDEDATDWYNQFTYLEYDYIWVFGDTNESNYPKYDGLATEYNVKQALQNMVNLADSNDAIAFISAGHGELDVAGNSHLCMWDCSAGENGEDGYLSDIELANILRNSLARNIFIFIDHCHSGGFGPELMAMSNKEHVFVTTSCTENGFGFEHKAEQNGAWTYYFLEFSWINYYNKDVNIPLEHIFSYAKQHYCYHDPNDPEHINSPQMFDGTAAYFYLV